MNMYDWLVHMATKIWLKKEDIYTLNTAFIYSLEYFGVGFPHGISFVETFKEQSSEISIRK